MIFTNAVGFRNCRTTHYTTRVNKPREQDTLILLLITLSKVDRSTFGEVTDIEYFLFSFDSDGRTPRHTACPPTVDPLGVVDQSDSRVLV